MNHLLRGHAPISDQGWALIDGEARSRLHPSLAVRRLVDFSGPLGWEHSAASLGRTSRLEGGPAEGVSGLKRVVLPLVELRADFELARTELRDADRGADDVDLTALDRAAQRLAIAENFAVLHGWNGATVGIAQASPHEAMTLGEDVEHYPSSVAGAVERLLENGVGGPYGLALGPEIHRRVIETAERGGYPLYEHLRKILQGPIVRAPGLDGAIVLSMRGGDFKYECGQDISIGYDSHDAETVSLYLQESFAFHVATPEAALALTP